MIRGPVDALQHEVHKNLSPCSTSPIMEKQLQLQSVNINHRHRTDNRQVRFPSNPVSGIAVCIATEDFGQNWYSIEDLVSFKIERRNVVCALRQAGGKIPDTALCVRGFEDYVSQATAIAKRQSIKNTIKAVLLEQERQRSEGLRDETKLAMISQLETGQLKRKAEHFGLCDAQEAFRLYAEYVQMIKSKNSVARTA